MVTISKQEADIVVHTSLCAELEVMVHGIASRTAWHETIGVTFEALTEPMSCSKAILASCLSLGNVAWTRRISRTRIHAECSLRDWCVSALIAELIVAHRWSCGHAHLWIECGRLMNAKIE